MSTTVKIDGLDKVLNSLNKLEETKNIKSAVGKGCAVAEAAAKKKAPKGVGDLRRSIKSKVEASEDAVKGIVYTPLEYAPYVEYGTGLFAEKGGRKDVPWNYKDEEGNWHSTSGMKPHPYMRPALQENRTKIVRIIKEGLTND